MKRPNLMVTNTIQQYLLERPRFKGELGAKRAELYGAAFLKADDDQDILSKTLILYTLLKSNTTLVKHTLQKMLAKNMGFDDVDEAARMLKTFIKRLIFIHNPKFSETEVTLKIHEMKHQINKCTKKMEKDDYQNPETLQALLKNMKGLIIHGEPETDSDKVKFKSK